MLKYDFHIHSALSPCADNEMTPNNIVNMAALMGLQCIAISDHNTVGNARAVIEAGKKSGLCVLPGIEVETEEEVHILTLFKRLEEAEALSDCIYNMLPDIKNRPDIFGEQIYMDENDNVLGIEEKLLISPAQLSINRLFELVKEHNGAFIPAHVDRHSYSVLTNLGFIPDELNIKFIEVSKTVSDIGGYLEARPDLKRYSVLQSSDSHRLESMVSEPAVLESDIEELFCYD